MGTGAHAGRRRAPARSIGPRLFAALLAVLLVIAIAVAAIATYTGYIQGRIDSAVGHDALGLPTTDRASGGGIIVRDDIVIFPEPNSIVEIRVDTLGAPLPTLKEEPDLPATLTVSAGGATLNTYGAISIQGTSTAKWPKKNWALKFYADEARTKRLRLKIGDSVASDKWIAKGEWIDPTMLRNALSYRLWDAMTGSRTSLARYEVDAAWLGHDDMTTGTQTGAQGFPPTHPALVLVNGQHYGLSMLVMGHDPQNFNIDPTNPRHVYASFDSRGGSLEGKTWKKFSAAGIDTWINPYVPKGESLSKEQRESIDALGSLINGPLEEFTRSFDERLDRTNMIDMLLLMEVTYDWDSVAQDIELVTYDAKKWYLLPWDKDTTFGMSWDTSGLKAGSATKPLFNGDDPSPERTLWNKTYRAFTPQVEARYAQLRKDGVFSQVGLSELAREITSKIPAELWAAERQRWASQDPPSMDQTSTSQILTWFGERLEMLDGHFRYTASR